MVHTVNAHDHFYETAVINSDSFTQTPTFSFGFRVATGAVTIFNDGDSNDIEYSFNGEDLHGVVPAKDKWHTLDQKKADRIWIRRAPPGGGPVTVRCEAWI